MRSVAVAEPGGRDFAIEDTESLSDQFSSGIFQQKGLCQVISREVPRRTEIISCHASASLLDTLPKRKYPPDTFIVHVFYLLRFASFGSGWDGNYCFYYFRFVDSERKARRRQPLIFLLGVCRFWLGRLGSFLFLGLFPHAIELADRDLRVWTNRALRSSHEKPPAKTRPEVGAFERKHRVA